MISFTDILKKGLRNPCAYLMIIIIIFQCQQNYISKHILYFLYQIPTTLTNDKYDDYIRKHSSYNLTAILDNIKHHKYLNNQPDLQLEAYQFATEIERLILSMDKANIKFEVISIVTNACPSTNWRINEDDESLKIFKNASNELINLAKIRRNITREQTQYDNNIRIIDYKDDNCAGMDLLYSNIENHRLVMKKHNSRFEHYIDYGIYWIIKFKEQKNYIYIISSPLSYQLDDKANDKKNYAQSHRVIYKVDVSEFLQSDLYNYLSLRISHTTIGKFLK